MYIYVYYMCVLYVSEVNPQYENQFSKPQPINKPWLFVNKNDVHYTIGIA